MLHRLLRPFSPGARIDCAPLIVRPILTNLSRRKILLGAIASAAALGAAGVASAATRTLGGIGSPLQDTTTPYKIV
jgi:hypothetical protein